MSALTVRAAGPGCALRPRGAPAGSRGGPLSRPGPRKAASPREAYALRLAGSQVHDAKTPTRTYTGKEAECEGGGAPSSAHGFDQAPAQAG